MQKLTLGEILYKPGYKAENATTYKGEYDGRPVIIKQGDKHLRREEKILKSIDHKGIPKVFAYIKDGKGSHFLVEELLPGKPLGQLIELNEVWGSKTLAVRDALRIVDGLAECVLAINKAGYLYRDLNLDHVLVSDKQISLVDLEWSIKMDSKTGVALVDDLAGTWETMSPEEFEVGGKMTLASNVFTLGTVLVQLLTGKAAYYITKQAEEDPIIRRQKTKNLMQEIPEIKISDKKISNIVSKALDPNPRKRYQSVIDFKLALSSVYN